MKWELKRIEPMRAANTCALVYALLIGCFSLLGAPFLLMGALFSAIGGASGDMGPMEPMFMIFFLLLYPILGLVMGWISGLLVAAFYNWVIRWTGGLLLDLDEAPATPVTSVPPPPPPAGGAA